MFVSVLSVMILGIIIISIILAGCWEELTKIRRILEKSPISVEKQKEVDEEG